jgi:predicted molibdopterin-dependent oxidoreductase YjgC
MVLLTRGPERIPDPGVQAGQPALGGQLGEAHGLEAALGVAAEFLGEATEVVIHPDDAAAADLSNGEALIVRSEHVELTGVAKVDATVRRGAVSVPHGHAGANVNLLTSKDDIDVVTGMTRYSGVPVSLHPA